jgi:hypothetical protein
MRLDNLNEEDAENYDWNNDEDFDEEDEEDTFDCHLGPDGLCGKAGSEECEFECPYRNSRKG